MTIPISIQNRVQPVLLFESPTGTLPFYFLADLPSGGRCSVPPDDKPGTLAIMLPTLPPGCIVGFIPPQVSEHMRPRIQEQKAKGAELAWVQIGDVRLFIYCDLPLGGQPVFTEGLGGLGVIVPTWPVPKGSIVAVVTPDLAERLRPALKQAIAAAKKAEAAGQNGHVVGA